MERDCILQPSLNDWPMAQSPSRLESRECRKCASGGTRLNLSCRYSARSTCLQNSQYSKPQQWTAFSDELLARIQVQPGLQESAVAVPRPIVDGVINLAFDIVGSPAASASASRTANYVSVSPEYFRVMGIPLLSGLLFNLSYIMLY